MARYTTLEGMEKYYVENIEVSSFGQTSLFSLSIFFHFFSFLTPRPLHP